MAVKIENNRRYEVNNVAEAFTIIATMLDANDCLGLTQLSDCTHFSKNKTFRLLSTLEQCGIVEKDQQCNYKMGVATIGIARKIMAKASLLDRARPYMEGLVKLVNEAVYFAYYSAGEAVLVKASRAMALERVAEALLDATVSLDDAAAQQDGATVSQDDVAAPQNDATAPRNDTAEEV